MSELPMVNSSENKNETLLGQNHSLQNGVTPYNSTYTPQGLNAPITQPLYPPSQDTDCPSQEDLNYNNDTPQTETNKNTPCNISSQY